MPSLVNTSLGLSLLTLHDNGYPSSRIQCGCAFERCLFEGRRFLRVSVYVWLVDYFNPQRRQIKMQCHSRCPRHCFLKKCDSADTVQYANIGAHFLINNNEVDRDFAILKATTPPPPPLFFPTWFRKMNYRRHVHQSLNYWILSIHLNFFKDELI